MPDEPPSTERIPLHHASRPAPRLDPERYALARRFLQVVGPIVLVAGLVCVVVGFVSLFASMNSSNAGPPRLFFLGAIGIPLMFIGILMSKLGYARIVADYAASELSPVASATVNYLGETTQDGVRAFGGALREGLQCDGTGSGHCPQCGVLLALEARFCQGCGTAVVGVDDPL